MKLPLPDESLDDRLGFFGTAGSGKTYNAMGRVERLLDRRARVVIPDPLGVWWGLRQMADGGDGYDVVIFGGPHGDLPLNEFAGALIGETVAGMKESCILDLSELGSKAGERRFMLAFLTALYRGTAGEPLHVVFDEADMWAPERLLDKEGEAAKLLGMMETLVRRGRVKGFIPWLISQRPAVVSKNVLSQVDGMVIFKLTSSQDRDAIGNWVEGQADKATWRQMYSDLATMERGQGVVWLPARGILDTVRFPAKQTVDSSRTPKRGEKAVRAHLKSIDLGALKQRLGTVEAEAKANDPKALKARIRELEAEVARKPAAVDPDALLTARQEGFRDGLTAVNVVRTAIGQHTADIEKAIGSIRDALAAPLPAQAPPTPSTGIVHRREPHTPAPRPSVTPTGSAQSLPRAERLILTVLAQRQPHRVELERVAAIAGYSAGGGGFNNAVSALRSKGFIEPGHPLAITGAGLGALGPYDPLPTGRALLQHWMGRVGKAERSILDAMGQHGPEIGKASLAVIAGYAADGGGFNNALSRLRTLGLIEGSGTLRLHEDLR